MTTMKLILTQEVTGLGTSGDTVEVKGGYGRNYLLPRGLAIKATRGAEKQIDSLRRARATREVRSLEEAQTVAGSLSGLTVRVPARAGAGGAPRGRGRPPVRPGHHCRRRRGRDRRRWPRAGPPPDRAAQQHQDHGPAHRHRAGAPRGQHSAGHRRRRRLTTPAPPTARRGASDSGPAPLAGVEGPPGALSRL